MSYVSLPTERRPPREETAAASSKPLPGTTLDRMPTLRTISVAGTGPGPVVTEAKVNTAKARRPLGESVGHTEKTADGGTFKEEGIP